ncbi:hypothetical protein Vadar_001714 [Vaccinium darrowii]|uniref:Uncharacterized protein n=1 Tax=Vaccinium darrowii TaxID=229202 RepID=A0ACB7Z0U4_9ERIC|nr:hypothetical protein Vadar_001714 [Vaccinium darrowii]
MYVQLHPCETQNESCLPTSSKQNDISESEKVHKGFQSSYVEIDILGFCRAANGHFFPREHIKKLETERKDILEKRIEEERKRIELTEGSTHKTRKVIKESEDIRKHIEKLEQERENTHVLHRELTPNGNTILHVAVQFGHVENVKVVLEERPHLVLEGNKKGETPLHMAARDGLADIVKELIQGAQSLEGGDLNVKKMLKLETKDDKDTALHMAARNCHLKEDEYLKVAKLLLKKAEEDEYWDPDFRHPRNKVDETPLYLAVERGKKGQEIVLELLKTCNSQDHYSGPGGRTALHAVAFHYKDSQDRSIVRELLTRMKDLINISDEDAKIPYKICWTPLQYAACSGNVLVMEELLKLNPDCWEMVDERGQNILHIAVDIVGILTIQYMNMKSAIDYIRNQDWFRHLINQKDNHGNTPLHLLVESDYRVDELWKHPEADKHVFNGANMTPVDLVWSTTIKKTKLQTFAAAYIEDETFLGSEIDGGRIIAFKEHENVAKFKIKRFEEEEKIKKKETDEKDKTREKKQIEARKASVTVYESLVIVAALIATISSAAAFAIPGGYDGNQGRDQGMAVLARTAAFKAFVITNTIALASSVTSILLCLNALYYYSISKDETDKITQLYKTQTMHQQFKEPPTMGTEPRIWLKKPPTMGTQPRIWLKKSPTMGMEPWLWFKGVRI